MPVSGPDNPLIIVVSPQVQQAHEIVIADFLWKTCKRDNETFLIVIVVNTSTEKYWIIQHVWYWIPIYGFTHESKAIEFSFKSIK